MDFEIISAGFWCTPQEQWQSLIRMTAKLAARDQSIWREGIGRTDYLYLLATGYSNIPWATWGLWDRREDERDLDPDRICNLHASREPNSRNKWHTFLSQKTSATALPFRNAEHSVEQTQTEPFRSFLRQWRQNCKASNCPVVGKDALWLKKVD